MNVGRVSPQKGQDSFTGRFQFVPRLLTELMLARWIHETLGVTLGHCCGNARIDARGRIVVEIEMTHGELSANSGCNSVRSAINSLPVTLSAETCASPILMIS